MATTQQRLQRLHNMPTRYEMAIDRGDTAYLIGYTRRHTRAGILALVRQNAEKIAALFGPEIQFAQRAGAGAMIGDWHVRFTGRTQRDCISNGELPFIQEVDSL